ncbi:MAG: hypothetical protein M5R40_15240 [Anaerolineae bacterium]|nr:hypothetical protein [Anaerolineae bacterium]
MCPRRSITAHSAPPKRSQSPGSTTVTLSTCGTGHKTKLDAQNGRTHQGATSRQ